MHTSTARKIVNMIHCQTCATTAAALTKLSEVLKELEVELELTEKESDSPDPRS